MRQGTQTAFRMTADEIRKDKAREYNPREWDKVIDRFQSYRDTEFFKIQKVDVYGYDRFYAVYTLSDGMRFMNSVGYSSSLTNGGFAEAFIFEFDEDFKFYDNGRVEISTRKVTFRDDDGTERLGMISGTPQGLEYMTRMSVNLGAIWTKELI